jgi:polyisoprenoid-binding protein YceI
MAHDDVRRRGMVAYGRLAAAVVAGWCLAVGAWPAPSPAAASVERFVIVPANSTVTYRVGETFVTGNRYNLAVGTTHDVQGEAYVDRVHPANSRIGPVTVNISTFQSDKRRRDQAIRDHWLESAKYPTAVFTPTGIRGLPATYRDGQDVAVEIPGTLRVRDVAKPVTFAGTVKLSGNTLTGKLQTTIQMTDFGFDPPSILGVLKAENKAQLELDFTAEAPQG